MEPDPLPPGYRIGDRYLIEGEIAPARMGRVYRATDSALHEIVAINVLSPQLRGTEERWKFTRAFRKAFDKNRGLVHELGEVDGIPFAVVAYIEGKGAAVDVAAV
jgi:hypothetical protein